MGDCGIAAHSDSARLEGRQCGLLNSEREAHWGDTDGRAGAGIFTDSESLGRSLEGQRREPEFSGAGSNGEDRNAAYANCRGREGARDAAQHGAPTGNRQTGFFGSTCGIRAAYDIWRWETAPQPTIRAVDDGLPAWLVRHRRPALAALGNSLVPQIAEAIGRAVMRVYYEKRSPTTPQKAIKISEVDA
jgi:hypothetical protein